jgi:hypothetical protein
MSKCDDKSIPELIFEVHADHPLVAHASEAAEKVTPNAFLAAHGAAPQRQINHL